MKENKISTIETTTVGISMEIKETTDQDDGAWKMALQNTAYKMRRRRHVLKIEVIEEIVQIGGTKIKIAENSGTTTVITVQVHEMTTETRMTEEEIVTEVNNNKTIIIISTVTVTEQDQVATVPWIQKTRSSLLIQTSWIP